MLRLSLREKAIKGGAFLLVRQAIGIIASVVGVLTVTRLIGPRQYGLFAAGAGIVTFLYTFGTWGLDACLLRKSDEPTEREFRQAFTLLLLASLVLVVLVFLFRDLAAHVLRMPEESLLILVLALGIPLNLLAVPAIVKLDRHLNFRQVAFNEVVSQIGYYLIAIPLAFEGAGAWAPVAGFLTQQASLLALSYWTGGVRPGLVWDRTLVRELTGYGLSYSSSIWVWQLRNLVNPVVVGRFAGAEAVGFVAVGVRIATLLSFAKTVTWRLAMPALAKLNHESSRLRNAISEGMRFQAVAVGIPLASFALLAPFLIPLGFGDRWTSAIGIFPFIALSYLSNAMFNLHSSVLYMVKRNWQVTWFHMVHVFLFAGSAVVLVPRIGLLGYGWAEIVALLSYSVIHLYLVRAVGSPSYTAPAIWYVSCGLAIVFGAAGTPALYIGPAILCAPLFFRKERLTLSGYAHVLFSRLSA